MTTKADRALAPRKQPRQGRARATLASILEAAAQVLETHGFEKMTTTRVAERAGTSVGSLYQYFPSKDALVVALFEQKVERVLHELEASVDGSRGLPFEERASRLIATLFRVKSERAELGAELARQGQRLDKRRLLQRLADQNHALVRRLLDEHRDELPIVDRDMASWLLVNAVIGIADAAMLGPLERLRDPAFIAAVTEHVLGAVRFDGDARTKVSGRRESRRSASVVSAPSDRTEAPSTTRVDEQATRVRSRTSSRSLIANR